MINGDVMALFATIWVAVLVVAVVCLIGARSE